MFFRYDADLNDNVETTDDTKDDLRSLKAMKVDIDLGLSAYANARK